MTSRKDLESNLEGRIVPSAQGRWQAWTLPAVWRAFAIAAMSGTCVGCAHHPLHTDGRSEAQVSGKVEVESTSFPDLGPMVPKVVRGAMSGPASGRIAIVDVDGLIVNQNLTGLSSAGENPVAAFREKLVLAAADPSVRAVVLRINSPGGGVAASETVAEELRRFRLGTNKPVVACLLDLATGGAYYLAVGADLIVAQPSTITGSVGALVNFYSLELFMSVQNITASTIKSSERVDMGSALRELTDDEKALFKQIVDGQATQFRTHVAQRRPSMTADDFAEINDGRIVAASRALQLHMIDRFGFLDDAIDEAERRSGCCGAEVVLLQREKLPCRSMYAITPNTPIQTALMPLSIPGLERSKLPTFLYLWQPDPTITRLSPP
jgi:protease-4